MKRKKVFSEFCAFEERLLGSENRFEELTIHGGGKRTSINTFLVLILDKERI